MLSKGEIALELLDAVRAENVLPGRGVVGDSGYGVSGPLRAGLSERGLPYVLGVTGERVVFLENPRWQAPGPGRHGRPRRHHRLEADGPRPLSLREVAARTPLRKVTWRAKAPRGRWPGALPDGACGLPTAGPRATAPTKQRSGCSSKSSPMAPSSSPLATCPLARRASKRCSLWRERWKIEQGDQQMKEEPGLDHFEGRSWRGFHHHAALVMLACGFLALEQLRARQKQPAPAQAPTVSGTRKKSRAHPPGR